MGDREVVGCGIRETGQCVGEGQVGVVHNLTVPVILHHDDKHVIQTRHALRNGALRGESGTRCYNAQKA